MKIHAQSDYRSATYSSIIGQNAEPEIFNEFNFNTYDLLTTNLQFSDKNSLQKVVFSPFKLRNEYIDVLSETKINLAQKDGISTFGVAIAYDHAAQFGSRANKLFLIKAANPPKKLTKLQFKNQTYIHNNKYDTSTWSLDGAYENYVNEKYALESKKAVNEYLKELTYPSFKVTAGINKSLFNILAGDEVDLDGDSLVDNRFTNKGKDLSLGFTGILSEGFAINLGYHYTRKRATSVEKQELASYQGFSVSLGGMIAKLDKNYAVSDQYLLELFIPSIVFGASFEYQECTDNTEFCENNIRSQFAFTPYLDFKIAPKNQFRLGVPIKSFKLVNEENITEVGPFVQYTLQLSGK